MPSTTVDLRPTDYCPTDQPTASDSVHGILVVQAITTKLFLAQFLNTTIIAVIINMNTSLFGAIVGGRASGFQSFLDLM